MATDDQPQFPGTAPRRGRLTLALLALAAVAALVVAGLVEGTRQRVVGNEAAQVGRTLRELLPEGSYDNEPDADRILVVSPELLGSDEPLPVYRARSGGAPAAAVITTVARQGYVGPIRLLVALSSDGRVIAVRVVGHRETPGLGDRIDAAKSSWTQIFSGRSLDDPDPSRWSVARDGGAFDQITGATVTSRAVVNAVRDAALYFRQNRAEIFARPAE